jgi:hypothetical protein
MRLYVSISILGFALTEISRTRIIQIDVYRFIVITDGLLYLTFWLIEQFYFVEEMIMHCDGWVHQKTKKLKWLRLVHIVKLQRGSMVSNRAC